MAYLNEPKLSSPFPVLRGAGPLAIAHRGGAAESPENSERAFRHSVSLGYSFLETDVRATRDEVAVVFHDASLDRTTNKRGRIRDLSWDEVSQARIHGQEPIMRLDELLARFPGTRFNIDVKESSAIVPFLDSVRRAGAWSRICAASFSSKRLRKLRRFAGPRLASSLSPQEVIALFLKSQGVPTVWRPPRAACVQIPVSVGKIRLASPGLVRAAHDLGWQVHVWTIDREATMEELVELGVDGIMTDRPSLLRSVLSSHGLWPDTTQH